MTIHFTQKIEIDILKEENINWLKKILNQESFINMILPQIGIKLLILFQSRVRLLFMTKIQLIHMSVLRLEMALQK